MSILKMRQLNIHLILAFFAGASSFEFLKNADMELNSMAPWECHGCTASISHDAYHGNQAILVNHRRKGWAGIQQTVGIQENKNYFFRAYLKLMNLAQGHLYHTISVKFKYSISGHIHYVRISVSPMQQLGFGYQEIGGDFHVPQGVSSITIYLEIPEGEVNYLIDSASVQEVPSDPNWKTKAQQRIEKYRKADLSIRFENHDNADLSDYKVQIKQKKSKFAFGTAVRADTMTDPTHTAYQDFVFNNFEWATIANRLKWRLMEFTQGHPIWSKGIPALDLLVSKGMKVRGHNMFWGVESHCPQWILNMTASELNAAMHAHIHGMALHTKGKLQHWDVNNENLHGDFYESRMNDANVTMKMFNWIKLQDSGPQLFLNEYNIVNEHSVTTAYKNQGAVFKASGTPIYGLGVQSHFHGVPKNMDVVKYRLDKVNEAGLPLWITELTISEPDENIKAQALEDILTLYHSYPSIEGVIFWGFTPSTRDHNDIGLVSNNIVANAAGQKYLELYHKTWRTNELHDVSSMVTARGFLGEYEISLLHNGNTVHTENVTLDNGGVNPTFHINGQSGNVHVSNVAFG